MKGEARSAVANLKFLAALYDNWAIYICAVKTLQCLCWPSLMPLGTVYDPIRTLLTCSRVLQACGSLFAWSFRR